MCKEALGSEELTCSVKSPEFPKGDGEATSAHNEDFERCARKEYSAGKLFLRTGQYSNIYQGK